MSNSLAAHNSLVANEEIMREWNFEKNSEINLNPESLTKGSGKSAWWKCEAHGHEWYASIVNRISKNQSCPICKNRQVLAGFNDLGSTAGQEKVCSEWHPTLNGDITPQKVTSGSMKKVWWKCRAHGHEWNASISNRVSKGHGCPVCSGRQVWVGVNDLASSDAHSGIITEWHPTKNGKLTPKDFKFASSAEVWWKCNSHGHEWKAVISSRTTNGNGCPICCNRYALAGFNDLGSSIEHSDIVAEWHPTKNENLKPQDVVFRSETKVWWKCLLHGHEWESTIASRTRKNSSGCPVCANRQVIFGYNDLQSEALYAEVVNEWHPTKNGELTPADFVVGSTAKIWWKCKSQNHEWIAPIKSRTTGNTGCPDCSMSKTERAFMESFGKISGFTFSSDKIPLKRMSRKTDIAQIDGYNKDLIIAIEYDGRWTHSGEASRKPYALIHFRDCETTEALLNAGYRVIRIREHDMKAKLPFVIVNPDNLNTSELVNNLHQVTYRSYGKNKDNIDELVREIINEKKEWFEPNS